MGTPAIEYIEQLIYYIGRTRVSLSRPYTTTGVKISAIDPQKDPTPRIQSTCHQIRLPASILELL